MPLISSANIACGGHAGDEVTMRNTLRLAQIHGVAAGAHPGFVDRENFGRQEMTLDPAEIFALVSAQVRTLQSIAAPMRISLTHVKPHGALYNLAAREMAVADAVAAAVRSVDERLMLVGLARGELLAAGRRIGLPLVSEVFADRTYRSDGRLTARSHAQALLGDISAVCAQVRSMVCDGVVISIEGTAVPVVADTICLHGDGPNPVEFAREVRGALSRDGIEARRINPSLNEP